jgi:hypothetical protein
MKIKTANPSSGFAVMFPGQRQNKSGGVQTWSKFYFTSPQASKQASKLSERKTPGIPRPLVCGLVKISNCAPP